MPRSPGHAVLSLMLEHATTVPTDLIDYARTLHGADGAAMRSLLLGRPELPDADADAQFAAAVTVNDTGYAAALMALRTLRATGSAELAAQEASRRITLTATLSGEPYRMRLAQGVAKNLFAWTPKGHPLRAALAVQPDLDLMRATGSAASDDRDMPVIATSVLSLDALIDAGALSNSAAGTASNSIAGHLNVLLKETGDLGRGVLRQVRTRLALRRWLALTTGVDEIVLDAPLAAHLLDVVVVAGITGPVPDTYASEALEGRTSALLADVADLPTCQRVLGELDRFLSRHSGRTDPVWRGLRELEKDLIRRSQELLTGCPVPADQHVLHAREDDRAALADWLIDQTPDGHGRWAAYAAVIDTLDSARLLAGEVAIATSGVLANA